MFTRKRRSETTVRRLALRRETLRHLSDQRLEDIAGGTGDVPHADNCTGKFSGCVSVPGNGR
jgi:hypothetical protein